MSISQLILPGPDELDSKNYYGYLDFINYEKKDDITHNKKEIEVENYIIKRELLVKIES